MKRIMPVAFDHIAGIRLQLQRGTCDRAFKGIMRKFAGETGDSEAARGSKGYIEVQFPNLELDVIRGAREAGVNHDLYKADWMGEP